jgi:GT2 family glycosyltransferase
MQEVEKTGERSTSLELSIVFVNWNSSDYLRDSLESIYANTAGIDFEVVVVDNASSEDEATKLRQLPHAIKVFASETNLGFARANNVGAQHSSGKYLLFLNPDTKVVGPAVANMLRTLESVGGAGVMGCKLLNSDGSVQTSCIQRFPTILNQILDIEFLRLRWPNWQFWGIEPLFSASTEPSAVEVISGACLMIDRESFEQVGGFSSRYFMYAEDVDLCYRVLELGRKVYYTPSATVIHYGGGTSRERRGSEWIAVMQRQAILKFCRITRGRVYAGAYRAATALNALCRLAFFAMIYPFRRIAGKKRILHATSDKWFGILKWALGLSRRIPGYNQGT